MGAVANGIEDAVALLEAGSYREFIQVALGLREGARNWGVYSAFSRKAGLSSRSFVRDVIAGRKRLSPSSLPKFVRGLGLRGDLRSYFMLLVARDEPSVNLEKKPVIQIEDRLARLRQRLRARTGAAPVDARGFLEGRNWFEIHAALGTLEGGATLAEVSGRTRLEPDECLELLTRMIDQGCVRSRAGPDVGAGLGTSETRYHAVSAHLMFSDLGANSSFREYYLSRLAEASRSARQRIDGEDRLFFTSVFSIASGQAPAFKQELRELMLRFVDRAENPQGDSVGRLVVAFQPD